MTVYEQILLSYGGYVLRGIRNLCEQNELYEECAEINKVFKKYEVNSNMTMEDWVKALNKLPVTGKAILDNAPQYFLLAVKLCKDKGIFKNIKESDLP